MLIKSFKIKFFIYRIAALHGYTDMCKLLIDKGSDINAITNGGYSPLHWCKCIYETLIIAN